MSELLTRYRVLAPWDSRKLSLIEEQWTLGPKKAMLRSSTGGYRSMYSHSSFEKRGKTPEEALDLYRAECEKNVARLREQHDQAVDDLNVANDTIVVDGKLATR